MIRPVALAIVLALVGCQSADVQRAQPTLTIPAAWRADVGPASPVEGVWWRNFHDSTLNTYDISNVIFLEDFILIITNLIFTNINLNLTFTILDVHKTSLTLTTLRHDTTCNFNSYL